ncbi:hypothetical protein [Verrucomicrobium spinosum]|uniref:hypothetical protein n=1 Tax=Verrucomicrobium spinosum TaxID=2736 RepID=UPI00155DAAC0|nr:hypothetical protein [Verrucomicrobium spinosum]
MKPLLCTLVAALSVSVFAADLTPEEWTKQEAVYTEQGIKQYATALKDPAFLEALQDARDAAEARKDEIMQSPDWSLKLLAKVHLRHYGRTVDAPAPVAPAAPVAAAQPPPAPTPKPKRVVLSSVDSVRAFWLQGISDRDPEICAYFSASSSRERADTRRALAAGQYDLEAQAFALRVNYKTYADAGLSQEASRCAEEHEMVMAQINQREAAYQAQQTAALAAEAAAIRAQQARMAAQYRADTMALQRQVRDMQAARAMRDQDAAFGRGAP